uniref:LRRCT domain-containing protein n=1 Tax=Sparus aurata TaxID=8175 RepID=A0A671Z0Y6_SPAAU
MLNSVLFLSVLSVTSLTPSETQSRKTKQICKTRCSCEKRENILNINCENKGFTTVGQFQAPPSKISQLFLNGNFLSRLSANEFVNYGNVTSLYLGNNGLQEIRTGAFNRLHLLKRLYLNNNNLEVIKKDTFAGLESLKHLHAGYNYISRNPWDCTCDLIPLKSWLDTISGSMGGPHAGGQLHSLRNEAICPEPSEVPRQQNPTLTKAPALKGPGMEPNTPSSSSSSSSSSFSSVSPTESQMHPEVPLLALIVGPTLFTGSKLKPLMIFFSLFLFFSFFVFLFSDV